MKKQKTNQKLRREIELFEKRNRAFRGGFSAGFQDDFTHHRASGGILCFEPASQRRLCYRGPRLLLVYPLRHEAACSRCVFTRAGDLASLRGRGGPFVCNCSTLLVRRAAADTLRAHFDVTQIPGVSRRRIHQIQSPSDASRSSKVLVQGSMSVCSTVSSSSSLRCSRLMICVVEHRISIQPQ